MMEYDDLLLKYALNSKNYKQWRKEHAKVFGELFLQAFEKNEEAQIHLTAALINISQRRFADAFPKLNVLESICTSDYDEAVVCYFLGLNYELLNNEDKMNEYYEKLRRSHASFEFPIAFHPYYRTAKFSQRDSECSKAVYYYRKALEIYDGRALTDKVKSGAGQIIYDIATIYLYMHEYDECDRFLRLSEEYDPSQNQQRNYVKAILYAVQNKISESNSLAEGMNGFFRQYLDPMLAAIKGGTDLHYCICAQDRSGYNDFWIWLINNKTSIENLLENKADEAARIISDKITALMPFMKRRLDCRIEYRDGAVTLYLKNYSVKTLVAEYEALISLKPKSISDWTFTTVNWYEEY